MFFRLYHKSTADESYHIVDTSVTSHMIEGLNPNTQYIVYVTAISKKGQSIPSETLIAWTDPAYPAFVEVKHLSVIKYIISSSSILINLGYIIFLTSWARNDLLLISKFVSIVLSLYRVSHK